MTGDELKVKVRLDTTEAKAALQDLHREGEATSAKTTFGINKAIQRGLGLVGAGAAFGAGMSMVTAAAKSSFGDIASETLGLYGAQLNKAVFGDLGPEARASLRAREETIQGFGMQAGMQGYYSQAAVNYYQQIRGLYERQEKGRQMAEADPRFRVEGMKDLGDRMGKAILDVGKMIVDGINSIRFI